MVIILAVVGVPVPYPARAADEPPAIAVEVAPRFQLAHPRKGGEVYVKVTVPRDARNRLVCVSLDGTTFRSSCWEHAGDSGAYRQEWAVRGLEPGNYVAVGELRREGGAKVFATYRFCISDGEAPCE